MADTTVNPHSTVALEPYAIRYGNWQASVTLADDATYSIADYSEGLYWVEVDGEQSFGLGRVIAASVGNVAGSSDFAVADTDLKLCLYVSGGSLIIKNRLGAQKTCTITRVL